MSYEKVIVRVRDLREGDWLDLRFDPFADLHGDDWRFDAEFATITSIGPNYGGDWVDIVVRSCSDGVITYTSTFNFPTDHYIRKVVKV